MQRSSSEQQPAFATAAESLVSLEEDYRRVAARLSNDLANGLTGLRFNTFEHRSRVLGRMASQIRTLKRGNETHR